MNTIKPLLKRLFKTEPTKAVTANADHANKIVQHCNYTNNYYGDQVCLFTCETTQGEPT